MTATDPLAGVGIHFHGAQLRSPALPLRCSMRSPLALGLMMLTVSACGNSEWERTSEALSPDRQYLAIAEYKGAPASNSDHRRVRLVQRNTGASTSGETVVSAANSDRAILYWENDDRLIVEVCGATSYEVKARQFREPSLKENGAENAIRIEAVAAGSIRNGRQLCATLPAKRNGS